MKRTFIVGEEWLYYKLYCGDRTADIVLTEAIKPLTERLLDAGLISQWFFIRYSDPKNHLRIRFHCTDTAKIGIIIEAISDVLDYYVRCDLIWKVQIDTYQRELERYGEETILEAEQLFFHDSVTCVGALNLIEEEELLFLFVLKSIDYLLIDFNFDIKEKINFVKKNKMLFQEEFKADKNLKKQLYKKYDTLQVQVEIFLSETLDSKFAPLQNLLDLKSKQNRPLKNIILKHPANGNLQPSLTKLLSSYIHMMVNRVFRDKQRLHELLCYDFLSRYYQGIEAKNLKQWVK